MSNYPESIEVNGRSYAVVYETSIKATSSVRIKSKTVHVNLSRFEFGGKRDQVVDKFLAWAEKKLSVVADDFIDPVYEDGGRVVTHNKTYDIVVRKGSQNRGRIIEGIIYATVSSLDSVQDVCEKTIIRDQIDYLNEVVEELNQLHFGEQCNEVKFKRTRSRFGSCSSKRNINISFRLLFAPREVFRYVCVHELAHLKEMNHSKTFWAVVEEAMPGYKESEKWLRQNGFALG